MSSIARPGKFDPKLLFGMEDMPIHHSGYAIPNGEPLYVMRGKDPNTPLAICHYVLRQLEIGDKLAIEHALSSAERLMAVLRYQLEHPERVSRGCHTCP